jgi:hypothetical protein
VKTLVALAAVIVVLAVSCTHAPQLNRTSDQVLEFRTHYLTNNPDDRFKEDIMKSKVHREMNYMQVLAAWGLPNVRTGVADDGSETWGYYAVDDVSRDVRRYDLLFSKNRLVSWYISDPDANLLHRDEVSDLPVISTSSMTMSSGLGSTDK